MNAEEWPATQNHVEWGATKRRARQGGAHDEEWRTTRSGAWREVAHGGEWRVAHGGEWRMTDFTPKCTMVPNSFISLK